jgi:lysozyme family protein
MTVFDKAFKLVIGAEGGYVNDPRDPGGETKFGISKRQYPNLDIKNLTLEQAKEIYYRDYWLPIEAGRLHERLAIYYFDCAVNQGVPTAKKLMQQHCGVTADGVIGNATRAAMMKLLPIADNDFMKLREERYRKTANFDRYGKGWLNRLEHLKSELRG